MSMFFNCRENSFLRIFTYNFLNCKVNYLVFFFAVVKHREKNATDPSFSLFWSITKIVFLIIKSKNHEKTHQKTQINL